MECELIELAAMEMAKADLGHNAWAMMPEAECNIWKARARFVVPIILERAAKVQPSTAADPNESDYQRGRFDGIVEFASAIRALAPPTVMAGEGE